MKSQCLWIANAYWIASYFSADWDRVEMRAVGVIWLSVWLVWELRHVIKAMWRRAERMGR